MTNEIVHQSNSWLAPAAGINQALERYQLMKEFVSKALRKGVDYDIIPGTSKDTLLKPGAEKLSAFFGLRPAFEDVNSVEDWTGSDHNDEMFFYYRQRCNLYRNEELMAAADGSCNSWEKKYRYRTSERLCPACNKSTIFKSNKDDGWFCWAKKGGCGAQFGGRDERITGQSLEQIPNPDIADQVNTILKMAQKRALVAAVLIAVNGSEYFTQDVEDMDFGVDVSNYKPQPHQPEYIEGEYIPEPITEPAAAGHVDTFSVYDLAIEKGKFDNVFNAKAAAKHSKFGKQIHAKPEAFLFWAKHYRAFRDGGIDKSADAAALADDEFEKHVASHK